MGRWFGLERRLRHSCQGRLQRQHRQEPETSFTDDVAATKRVLAHKMDRAFLSVIAMGSRDYRSWHGLIRRWFGVHRGPHADAGENEADDGKRFPVISASLVL